MKKSRRLRAGLLSAVMAALLTLGCCGPEEPQKIDELVLPKNDGQPAKLTVAIETPEDMAHISTNGSLDTVFPHGDLLYSREYDGRWQCFRSL